MVKDQQVLQQSKQSREIIWNIVNSLLAGSLVLLGGFVDGDITWKGLCFAVVAGLLVAVTKFQKYWSNEEGEYSTKLFSFIK